MKILYLEKNGEEYNLYGVYVCHHADAEHMAQILAKTKAKVIISRFDNSFNDLYVSAFKNLKISVKITERKSVIYKCTIGQATITSLYNLLPDVDEIDDLLKNYPLDIAYNMIIGYLKSVLNAIGAHKTANNIANFYSISKIAFEALKETSEYSRLCKKTTESDYMKYKTAYRAGFVYAKSGVYEQVSQIDKISAYPSVYSFAPLPVGKPFVLNDKSELQGAHFYIVNISARFKLKKGYIPIISVPLHYGISEYIEESDEYINLTLSKRDYELFCEYYDADIVFNWADGWATFPNLFRNYGTRLFNYKNADMGMYKKLIKYMLNTPYGKFGSNGRYSAYTYNCVNGEISKTLTKQTFREGALENLPLAIAITSEVRYNSLKKAQEIGFENVIYMHTDSIKGFFDEYSDCGENMGDWKLEPVADYMAIRGKMKYARYYVDEYIKGEPIYRADYTVSGIPKEKVRQIYKSRVSQNEITSTITRFMSDGAFDLGLLDSENFAE